ncbi:CBS domain-containing protein [Desulfomicrobium baculatum]|uniref:CBS domain containing membrane protein n=1 Tax=Desulfomicrobium baculatum (strain DSM 4028 / VKM B-1378 / X) TaxID=525897 RepID=C7LXE1_DESBD|nr:CBS domain-containing protein [Desulfomicrobium baculatum]ACU90012.1 CBS domain containing membrane protein [Desulfomicrobium baculatum DSM 4028]
MNDQCGFTDLTEEDVLDAMRSMQGYVDITPGTFREIYALAYDLALKRVRSLGTAEDIMTAPVHCLQKGMSASEAAALMAGLGISGAPVLDVEGRICGVVSEKDYLRKMGLPGTASFMTVVSTCLSTPGCMVTDVRKLLVDDIMSSPPVVASRETPVAELSEMLARHSINRLPICDEEGRPVGIVTRTDLVGSMCGR